MRCIAILTALVPLSLAAQTPPPNDWTIVPGVRVGAITIDTLPGDLRRLFPKEALEEEEIELDEGMLQPGTFVYRKNPSEALAIVWKGKGPQAHPKEIFVCYGRRRGPCRWQVSGGIKIGTRMAELEAMNGRPFTVSGFGWNYGGNVLSWDGGDLARLDCGGRLVLTLDGERSRPGEYSIAMTPDEVHAISGDRPISSSVAPMRKLNPGVVGILFQFPGPDSKKCSSM
jgi:hypothetical protein